MDLHCSPKQHSLVYSPLYYCIGIFLLLNTLLNNVFADDLLVREFNRLDQQYQQLTNDIYSAYGKVLRSRPAPANLQELQQQVDGFLQENDQVSAISLLQLHGQMIKDNLDDKRILGLVAVLLKYNAWSAADDINSYIREQGDKYLGSNLSFVLAKHYLERNEWQKTVDELVDSYDDLVEEDASYARLITGIALQKLKQHRKAVEFYSRIPSSSSYYIYARLNTAIAYIRQGWWTDAQITIKDSLNDPQISKPDEMVNRLYLVLGYSMLQNEYYRDSRNAFRNISLDSRYTNRALLGIALSAANQEDYIGALNALSILKDKKTRDLSVDECYLLFPYTYQKLNQQMTASATYTDAINYYQARMAEIANIKNTDENITLDPGNISDDNKNIVINNNSMDYASHYPPAFLANLKRLQAISGSIKGQNMALPAGLITATNSLLQKHRELYRKIINSLLDERKQYLGSYLNQSRYGLANLYDSSILNEN